jgi:hypothetical protein
MGIVITHGPDPAFESEAAMQRALADAIRLGLERAGLTEPHAPDILFASYGDIWTQGHPTVEEGGPNAAPPPTALGGEMPESPTDFQATIAAELMSEAGVQPERSGWESLGGMVGNLDAVFHVGEPAIMRFVMDLDDYFRDPEIRGRWMTVVRGACVRGDGTTLLLAHGIGSIVAYDLLATHGARSLGVTGLVTFGSPLGLQSIRRRLDWFHPGTPIPDHLAVWTNVYNRMDFATVVRRLSPLYVAKDGRGVADLEAVADPSAAGTAGGHDPLVYLRSIAVAQVVRALFEPAGRGPDLPAASEAVSESAASVPPLPQPRVYEEIDPPAMAPPSRRLRPSLRGAAVRGMLDRLRGADRGATRRLPRSPASEPAVVGVEEPTSTGVAAAGTKLIERTASANFPPVVQPGSTHELVFAVSGTVIHAQSAALEPIEVPEDEKTMILRVGVYAADFDVEAADDPARTWAPITVDLVNPDAVAEGRFRLTAHALEERRETLIYLTFYRGNLPVGQLPVLTAIDPDIQVGIASISVRVGGAPDPDYVLIVTDRSPDRKGAGPFDISVSKELEFLNMPLGSFPVSVDAWEYASSRLEGFRKIKDEPSTEERIRAAQLLGIQLWIDLPDDFRRFYWEELHGREGASIAVYSQEPYIPWELIKPQREPGGEEDGFLGAVFNMARWKQAVHFPDPLTVSRFSVIAPEYGRESGNRPLPSAQKEAGELVKQFGAEPIAGTRKLVRQLLESDEGVQLIHFAGHGEFSPESAEMSSIWMADAPLVPGDLTHATLGRAAHPFVFLNACEVGERGWALTRIGGWAEAFTDVGFSGFVGPYWAVTDRVALKAALLFYRSLSAGLTVAEAVRHIRLKFYTDDEDPGHPSWLAYTLHCQPNIRIQMVGTGRPTAMSTDEAA